MPAVDPAVHDSHVQNLWCAAAFGLLLLLAACATTRQAPRPVATPATAWQERVGALQRFDEWSFSGRAAVAVGTQGWQASLDWRQQGAVTEAHLAGPLGVGATLLKLTPEGLSINGGESNAEAVAQLQDRLGFELPLARLRYWVLGVPAPGEPADLVPNSADRAQELRQAGWTITYDRYLPVSGDVLPTRLVLTRDLVRVRIIVDHWDLSS
jgi:outer membrane lipoprotein LolB